MASTTGTCPSCGKKKLLKKCVKCGTVTCGVNHSCGSGWCPVCRGKLKNI